MICEAFGCPPSVALEQDASLVRAVLEARTMSRAHELSRQQDGMQRVKDAGLMEAWWQLHEIRQERAGD